MNEKEKKAVETMVHWIEYEKANKDKINKADELIEIQETVLNLLEKKDKMINEMAYDIATNNSDFCQHIDETRRCKKYAGENKLTCDECIKQYFEREIK